MVISLMGGYGEQKVGSFVLAEFKSTCPLKSENNW